MTPALFAQLCYCVLMQNGDGILDKSPDYISEKGVLMNEGYNAYGFLDRYNQRVVLEYFDRWRLELPNQIARYEEELKNLHVE